MTEHQEVWEGPPLRLDAPEGVTTVTDMRMYSEHQVPWRMVRAPHIVFRNGMFALRNSDYSVARAPRSRALAVMTWSLPLQCWERVTVVRLDTGEQWLWSPDEG